MPLYFPAQGDSSKCQESCSMWLLESHQIQCVKDYLLQQFRIKDLGDLKYFLGIEFSRSKTSIYMSQRKYALDIL